MNASLLSQTGRRFQYLLYLPTPACASDQCPIEPVATITAVMLNHWWHQRCSLANEIATYNRAVWCARNATNSKERINELLAQLNRIAVAADGLRLYWAALFNDMVALGSAVRARGRFVPVWKLCAQSAAFEFSDRIGLVADEPENQLPPLLTEHLASSMVFETTALHYLLLACKQQRVTFAQILNGPVAACVPILQEALESCSTIIERVVPLHFGVGKRQESWLISTHFYTECIRPLLVAQKTYLEALLLQTPQISDADKFDNALQFIRSATLLRQASRTPYARPCNLDRLALYRHGSALLLLAVLFETNRGLDTDPMCAYRSPNDSPLTVPHALLVEAIACARVGALLLDRVPAAQKLLDRLVARAQTEYNLYISLPQVDLELARDNPAVSAAWRTSIKIEQSSTKPTGIVCEHRMPRAEVVDLSSDRRYTLQTER